MVRNPLDVFASQHTLYGNMLPELVQAWPDFIQYSMTDDGKIVRPFFSLHKISPMHKIPNPCKLGLNWSSRLQENNTRKSTLVAQNV